MDADFIDVGSPLSPAEAGLLEHELEKRGLATRLRFCDRDEAGDHQAVQVTAADLPSAMAIRAELFPAAAAPPPPLPSRSHRLRNGLIAAITLAEVPRVVRLVRGLVLSLREQTYVEAAIAAGTTLPRILMRHILPNIVAPLLVQGTYVCGSAMITEAILSFIGAGTPPNIPSWGNIMAEGRSLVQIAGYLILFPGICLSLTVLAVNLLGDGMRDALDPRLARRM